MYKSIRRFALGGSVVVASVLVVTLTSVAAKVAKVETESYKNVATGLCLESNGARQVYTQGCNGSSYQKWRSLDVRATPVSSLS